MIVITIMSIMGGLGLAAMAGATNLAREHRAGAMVKKIDGLIMERWEGYRTRALAIRIPPGTSPRESAAIRLNGLRDLMRMEMPDRITDVADPPAVLNPTGSTLPQLRLSRPSLQASYQRRLTALLGPGWGGFWTVQHQGSECLYLILSTMRDNDKSALDYFDPTEIGDTDGDGVPEILDGWGTPVEFLRWAPGYLPQNGVVTIQTNATVNIPAPGTLEAPDPFDPAKADPRWQQANPPVRPFLLHPLIVSAGRDRQIDIAMQLVDNNTGGPFHYTTTTPVNDPYFIPNAAGQVPLGTPGDADGDGTFGYLDNITNHDKVTP